MIEAQLTLGDQIVRVSIEGNNLVFTDVGEGVYTTIEGLKIEHKGVIKEFPDLKDNEDWRKIAIERFKEHFKKIEGEKQKMMYVVGDLEKWGWVPNFWFKKGFRPQRFK